MHTSVKMSSLYVDVFWQADYVKLELCFRRRTFFAADYIDKFGENVVQDRPAKNP